MLDFGQTRLCKITATGDDGTYTATEVARKADNSGWDTLTAPSGLVGFTLREINDSEVLAVDDIVPFWRALGKGENWRYLCVADIVGLVVNGTPDDEDILQFNYLYNTWDPVAPSTLVPVSLGWDLLIPQYIRFDKTAATQEVIINATDLRGKLLKFFCTYTNNTSAPPAITLIHGQSYYTSVIYIKSPPNSDVTLTNSTKLDLIVDKDDGKLKWSYTQDNTNNWWGYCEVYVRSATPDHIVTP